MRITAIAAGTLMCAALVAVAVMATSRNDARPDASALAGVSASMHFTNDDGTARIPSAEERAALADAFQADLASLTNNRRLPKDSSRTASGAETAVVATRSLRYLVVSVDENGQPAFDHSAMDEAGHIDTSPARDLPEM